jgi:hypothetical protein
VQQNFVPQDVVSFFDENYAPQRGKSVEKDRIFHYGGEINRNMSKLEVFIDISADYGRQGDICAPCIFLVLCMIAPNYKILNAS